MRIVVYTLGCKVNQYESDGIINKLKEMGHDVYNEIAFADIYILNTCAVTNEAEKKSRQMIAKFREQNGDAKVIVCGCASQKNAEQFLSLPNVSLVLGNANKNNIPNILEQKGLLKEDLPTLYEDDNKVIPTKTRAYVKIQDGCNNFCTYCIIPYLRGRSRSKDLTKVKSEVDYLSKMVKEIVITGINITDYKIDGVKSFDKIIEIIKNYPNVRFRLGSIEDGLIDEDFVKQIKDSNICPHFHLSLQSGSDNVLKAMNRRYTTGEFKKSVELLKKHFKNPAITTDIIVGFPNETEEDFEQTCKFAKEIGFYNIHIFPYSKRSGTIAEKMQDINGSIKKDRVKKLKDINSMLNKKYVESSMDVEHEVLIEEKIGDYFVGHSENYIKCYINANLKLNEFYKIRILKCFKDGAFATLV